MNKFMKQDQNIVGDSSDLAFFIVEKNKKHLIKCISKSLI